MSKNRVEIAVELIDVSKAQVRSTINQARLADLTESVRANGVLQSIDVVANGLGRFDVLFGHRRVLAALEAGVKMIWANVHDAPPTALQETVLQLTENVTQESLNGMDVAVSLHKLTAAGGLTAGQAAKQVGMSAPDVTKFLALNKLPSAIQDRVRSGQISASAAYLLSQMGDDRAAQAEMADRVAAGEMTRDQLAGTVRRAKSGAAPAAPTATQRVTAPLGDGRAVALSGPGVDTMDGLIQCLEDLLSRARKVRPQGIGVSTFVKMLRDQAKGPPAGGSSTQG